MPRRDCRINGARTTAEPARESTEDQTQRTEKCGGRNTCGCGIRRLLRPINGLAVLLLILRDPVAGFLGRNVLGARQSSRRTLAGLLSLRLIAGQHGA